MSRTCRPRHYLAIVAVCLPLLQLLLGATEAIAQAPTPKQRQAVNRINTAIDRAGKQFKAERFEASSEYIEQAAKQIEDLAVGASGEVIELLKPEHKRLVNARKLLVEAGQSLPEIKPLPVPMAGDGAAVSFRTTVAPILVAKCGNCHVNRNRGNFSAATFQALDQSTTIAYGLPQDSRLIEVIENGEMPKGGLKVEPSELEALKLWIKQGAKYDGDSPTQNLSEFVAAPADADDGVRPMTPKMPTGKETVSFGLHIAPVILENCATCHLVRNPRGNFSMASFRQLLAGGDSGSPIVPGKSSESELIKRLRGEEAEQMPPSGKLDDKIIEQFAKWIDEGAAFDGGNARLELGQVAAKVKANAQTHEQLVNDRAALAEQTWKLAMDGVEKTSVPSENFLVTGSTNESRLADVSLLSEKLLPKVVKAMRADSTQPFVKGNISIFVFDKRYDFNEFGKMVEGRDFAKEVSSHWGYTIVDAYATVLMTRNQSAEDLQVDLVRQFAALHVASQAPDIPRWYADGNGYWVARKVLAKDDAMKSLDSDATAAAATMTKPDDFVTQRMVPEQAALVSYLFVNKLRSDRKNFAKFSKLLAAGNTFAESFEQIYGGTPAALLSKKW